MLELWENCKMYRKCVSENGKKKNRFDRFEFRRNGTIRYGKNAIIKGRTSTTQKKHTKKKKKKLWQILNAI